MLQTGESRHLRQIAFAVAALPMAVLFNFPSVVLSALNGIINQISEVECLKSKGRAACAAGSAEITADTYAKHIERNPFETLHKAILSSFACSVITTLCLPSRQGASLSLIEEIDFVFIKVLSFQTCNCICFIETLSSSAFWFNFGARILWTKSIFNLIFAGTEALCAFCKTIFRNENSVQSISVQALEAVESDSIVIKTKYWKIRFAENRKERTPKHIPRSAMLAGDCLVYRSFSHKLFILDHFMCIFML